jgi:hypothetical protein
VDVGGHQALLVGFGDPGGAVRVPGLVSQDRTGALVRDSSARVAARSSHSVAATSGAATIALSAGALTRPPTGTSATTSAVTSTALGWVSLVMIIPTTLPEHAADLVRVGPSSYPQSRGAGRRAAPGARPDRDLSRAGPLSGPRCDQQASNVLWRDNRKDDHDHGPFAAAGSTARSS